MEYVDLCGDKVSRLGMGNMRLPKKLARIDYSHAESIIDYALESGINYFDTAPVYLGSEDFLGKALISRHPREGYYLATKYFCLGNPNYRKAFESQLKRLKTDYIDYFLIHSVNDANWKTYANKGSIEYFLKMKEEGRIRHLGFSTHASLETTERFADLQAWDFAQVQINYYDWAFGHARQEYEIFASRNIPVVVMEPVRGGKLAQFKGSSGAALQAEHPDWSAASWALRWVECLDNAKVILSGMSSLDQIEDNVATFNDRPLDARESDLLMQSCGAIRKSLALPCTACRYCTDACPVEIDIPLALDAYNERAAGNAAKAREIIAGLDRKPSECIACGACSQHCPQLIDIPKALAELAG